MKTQEALDKFITDNAFYYRPTTLDNYKNHIQGFFDFTPQIQDIEAFEADHIEKWMGYLHEFGLKPTTIYSKFYALKALYVYLNEVTEVSICPTTGVEIPKYKTGTLPIVDRITMFKLRNLMKVNLRDRCILETLYATGVRVQELCDIQISHIHMEERQIIIPKGKDLKPRIVLFSPYHKEWLLHYLSTRHDDSPFLFITRSGKQCTRQAIHGILRKYCTQASLPKNISPHAFRRTFATILYKNGVPIEYISLLMGHASIKNTEHYIKTEYMDLI